MVYSLSIHFVKFFYNLYFVISLQTVLCYNVREVIKMNRIRSARRSLNMTQKELGLRIGATEGAVSHYETGRREPDNATLGRIASVLNVSTDYLLGVEKSKKPGMPTVKVVVDPSAQVDGATKADKAIAAELAALSPAEKDNVLAYIRFLKSSK